jgi:hypothetical protein
MNNMMNNDTNNTWRRILMTKESNIRISYDHILPLLPFILILHSLPPPFYIKKEPYLLPSLKHTQPTENWPSFLAAWSSLAGFINDG